jgi:hypothetical protein
MGMSISGEVAVFFFRVQGDPAREGSRFVEKYWYLPNYTASHLRRP